MQPGSRPRVLGSGAAALAQRIFCLSRWVGRLGIVPSGRRELLLAVLGVALCLSLYPPLALGAESGLAVAPAGDVFLVNKDVNGERWTILASVTANGDVVSIAGVVRQLSGEVGKFVSCSLRPDSPCKSLSASADPSCRLRLQCDGADACADYAVNCSKDWKPLVDDLALPVSFFIRGSGASSSSPAEAARVAAVARPSGGGDGSGSTLTPRLETFLSSKPVGSERWSVALQVDRETRRGIATGNVFLTDASPPKFVYCGSKPGIDVLLSLVAGVPIEFDCVGTDRCESDPNSCRNAWTPIASAPVPVSLFLPDKGLQKGTSINFDSCFFKSPPCVQPPASSAASQGVSLVAADSCAIGASCSVAVSACGTQSGQIVRRADGRCACEVSIASANCRPCVEAGEACSIGVQTVDGCSGGSCAREEAAGVCQAVSSSGELLCTDPLNVASPTCGGAAADPCSAGNCCVDDARDGCDQAAGDVNCGGLCVPGSSGSACFTPGRQKCPNSQIDAGEDCDSGNLNGASCESLGLGAGTLACTRGCSFDTRGCVELPPCGNGDVDPGEQCDQQAFAGKTCQSLGFAGGALRCTADCTIDTSSCEEGPSCGNGRIDAGEDCDPPGILSFEFFSERCDPNSGAPNLIDICCPGICRSTTPATCTQASSPDEVPQSTIERACSFVR